MPRTRTGLLLALVLGGCATPGPYAEVDDGLYERSDPSRYSAKVIAIDGERLLESRVLLSPGPHRLSLISMGAARGGAQGAKILALEAQACVRYYVIAQHACAMCDDWEPRIYREEPMDDCGREAVAPP